MVASLLGRESVRSEMVEMNVIHRVAVAGAKLMLRDPVRGAKRAQSSLAECKLLDGSW